MPKRRKTRPGRAAIQLPLFTEAASLIRVRPEANEWRFYRMEIWPDLFSRALLVRHWGRLGTQGRRRLDPHPDPGAAIRIAPYDGSGEGKGEGLALIAARARTGGARAAIPPGRRAPWTPYSFAESPLPLPADRAGPAGRNAAAHGGRRAEISHRRRA